MTHDIHLEHITKIEGDATLKVRIEKGRVETVELRVLEGARFFEGIIKRKNYRDVTSLVSRICGICSCIHQAASLKTLETALEVEPSEQTLLLRELMCLGERLRSHATHLYFLALPDYLGFGSAVSMGKKHKDKIARALRIVALGNDIVETVGGRDIHPVTGVVGGFSKMPTENEMDSLLKRVKAIKQDAVETAELFSKLKYPTFERETQYFALEDRESYSLLEGEISCVGNYCIPVNTYVQHFEEYIKPYSTAKFVVAEKKGYRVGSLARVNNNMKFMSRDARKIIKNSGIKFPNHNPFVNNFCQAVENVHEVDRIIEILNSLELKDEKPPEVKVKACHGVSAVEAPRGILFHDYELDGKGNLAKANIITPTQQNLLNIEDDIRAYLPMLLSLEKERIILELEKLIRSYDPCISCSTHFLKVKGL
ncbi:MAG: Ni/Fe hydrogenase subunit alpha [Candidatus Altiarchaeota archaeon]